MLLSNKAKGLDINFYLIPIDIVNDYYDYRAISWETSGKFLGNEQNDLLNYLKSLNPNDVVRYVPVNESSKFAGVSVPAASGHTYVRVLDEFSDTLAGVPAGVLRQQMESFLIN